MSDRTDRSSLFDASKLLERIAAKQLITYSEKSALLPRLQSEAVAAKHWTGHSSETAVLKVLSDIILGIDAGDLCAGAIRFIRSLRHGRPPHSSAAPGALLWHNWFGASMVPVLSGWPLPIRPNCFVYFVSSADSL